MNDARKMFYPEYDDNTGVEYKDKGPSYRDRCHKERYIILECGIRPSDAFFEIDDGEVEAGQVFVLDRLRIDVSCLKKPLVKIEFSSLVVFEAEDEKGPEHEV